MDDTERIFREVREREFKGFRERMLKAADFTDLYPEPAFLERAIRQGFDRVVGEGYREIAAREGDVLSNMMTELYIQASEVQFANDDMPEVDRREEFLRQLGEVRDTTRSLIKAVMVDAWPTNAACIDFGLDGQEHYEALYHPIREMEIMPKELDDAMGDGRKLTDMARASPSNPHAEISFHTSWDGIYGRPAPPGAMTEEAKLERTMAGLAEKQEPWRGKLDPMPEGTPRTPDRER